MKNLILLVFVIMCNYVASAQTTIAVKDAAKHLNETVVIDDKVYSTELVGSTNTVLLNLGGTHPNQYLTVVIKGNDRAKFHQKPEEYYKGQAVTVTGKLINYMGKPGIIVSSPTNLKVDLIDNIVKPAQKVDKP